MIESIFVAAEKGSPPVEVHEIQVVARSGIVGDRHFNKHRVPGENMTLIEAEEVERFNTAYGQSIEASSTRRNIVTRSVRLNELVGQQFKIGDVVLYGVELCEPCSKFGKALASSDMESKDVIKAWIHKAGLRVDVQVGGIIRMGMNLKIDV
jgi:MOSC domain-containing protein YiiM